MKINVLRYRDLIRESYSRGASFWDVNVEARQEVEIHDNQFIAIHERIDFVDEFGGREKLAPSINFEVRRGKNLSYHPLNVGSEAGPRQLLKCVSLIVSDTQFQVIVDVMIHGKTFGTPDAEFRSYLAESYLLADFPEPDFFKLPYAWEFKPHLIAA